MVALIRSASRRVFFLLLTCAPFIADCRSIASHGGDASTDEAVISNREETQDIRHLLFEKPSNKPSRFNNGSLVSNPPKSMIANESDNPSTYLTSLPSIMSSEQPSKRPSSSPSFQPNFQPSHTPTQTPTMTPSGVPSSIPSTSPSLMPSALPTLQASSTPSSLPSLTHSTSPSLTPTMTPPVVLRVNVKYERYYYPTTVSSSSMEADDVDEDLYQFFLDDYYGSDCTIYNCGRRVLLADNNINNEVVSLFDIQSVKSKFGANVSCEPKTDGSVCKYVETDVAVRYYPAMFSEDRIHLIVASTIIEFMEKRAIDTSVVDPILNTMRTQLNMILSGVQNIHVDENMVTILEDSVGEFLLGISASAEPPIEISQIVLSRIHEIKTRSRRGLKKRRGIIENNAESSISENDATSYLHVDIAIEGYFLPSVFIDYFAEKVVVTYFEQNIDHFVSILKQSETESFAAVQDVKVTLVEYSDEGLAQSDDDDYIDGMWFIIGAVAIICVVICCGICIWCMKSPVCSGYFESLDKLKDAGGYIVEDDCDENYREPVIITRSEHNRRMRMTSEERYAEMRSKRKIKMICSEQDVKNIRRLTSEERYAETRARSMVQQESQSYPHHIAYSYSMERFLSGIDMQPTSSETYEEETSGVFGYAVVGD